MSQPTTQQQYNNLTITTVTRRSPKSIQKQIADFHICSGDIPVNKSKVGFRKLISKEPAKVSGTQIQLTKGGSKKVVVVDEQQKVVADELPMDVATLEHLSYTTSLKYAYHYLYNSFIDDARFSTGEAKERALKCAELLRQLLRKKLQQAGARLSGLPVEPLEQTSDPLESDVSAMLDEATEKCRQMQAEKNSKPQATQTIKPQVEQPQSEQQQIKYVAAVEHGRPFDPTGSAAVGHVQQLGSNEHSQAEPPAATIQSDNQVLGFYTFKDVVIEDLLDRSGQIIEPPEEYRGQSAIQLDLLYTFPLCRRHRVATALIEHAKTKLLQENQKSLLLVEFEDQDRFGNTAEQYEKFFGKFGFKTIQSCKKKHELRKSTVNHVRMVYSAQK